MTKKEIATLALKLMGIYAFIQALSQAHWLYSLFGFAAFLEREPDGLSTGGSLVFPMAVVVLILQIALGVVLFFGSDRLSSLLISDDHSASTHQLSARGFQSVAFSVVGVYAVFFAIPRIVSIVPRLVDALSPTSSRYGHGRLWAEVAAVTIQLILGLALFFWGAGLSERWHKLSSPKNEEPE